MAEISAESVLDLGCDMVVVMLRDVAAPGDTRIERRLTRIYGLMDQAKRQPKEWIVDCGLTFCVTSKHLFPERLSGLNTDSCWECHETDEPVRTNNTHTHTRFAGPIVQDNVAPTTERRLEIFWQIVGISPRCLCTVTVTVDHRRGRFPRLRLMWRVAMPTWILVG